ncbi:5172_t:CDS:2, partial [Cetraspora pellucida]
SGELYGPSFTAGDIIGCCLNFRDKTVFFTKNGVHLDVWNRALYEFDSQQKIDDFEDLKKLSKNETNFYQYQAKACLILGRYNEALESLTTILNIDKIDTFALKYRAEIYYLMKKYKESLADLENLLKIKKNNTWAMEVRKHIFMKR